MNMSGLVLQLMGNRNEIFFFLPVVTFAWIYSRSGSVVFLIAAGTILTASLPLYELKSIHGDLERYTTHSLIGVTCVSILLPSHIAAFYFVWEKTTGLEYTRIGLLFANLAVFLHVFVVPVIKNKIREGERKSR